MTLKICRLSKVELPRNWSGETACHFSYKEVSVMTVASVSSWLAVHSGASGPTSDSSTMTRSSCHRVEASAYIVCGYDEFLFGHGIRELGRASSPA